MKQPQPAISLGATRSFFSVFSPMKQPQPAISLGATRSFFPSSLWIMTFLQVLVAGSHSSLPSRQLEQRSGSHSLLALKQEHALVVHFDLHLHPKNLDSQSGE